MMKRYPTYPIHTDSINVLCDNLSPTDVAQRIRYAYAVLMIVFTHPPDRPFRAIAGTLKRLITSKY